MLDILNKLKIFFEDNYIEVGIREYSRIIKLSPPTASNLLKLFEKENLLKKREDKGYLLFRANRENWTLKELSRIYWKIKLTNLVDYLNKELNYQTIILFGSLSKLETKKDSDIDIAIISKIKKEIDLKKFNKELNREIHLFQYNSLDKINPELRKNILNGCLIQGEF